MRSHTRSVSRPRRNRRPPRLLFRLAEITGDVDLARLWYAGLREAVSTLSEQPRRYAVRARESQLIGRETRCLLYRRTSGSVAYHVFYFVEEDGDDGPRVIVFRIRHASRRPMTSQEAQLLRLDL